MAINTRISNWAIRSKFAYKILRDIISKIQKGKRGTNEVTEEEKMNYKKIKTSVEDLKSELETIQQCVSRQTELINMICSYFWKFFC